MTTRAFKRIFAKDSKIGERLAATLVSSLMSAKMGLNKVGLGLKNNGIRKKSRRSQRKRKNKRRNAKRTKSITGKSLNNKFKAAIRPAKRARRNKKTPKVSRILQVPSAYGGGVQTAYKKGFGFYLKPANCHQRHQINLICEMKRVVMKRQHQRKTKKDIKPLSNFDIENLVWKLRIPYFVGGLHERDTLLKKAKPKHQECLILNHGSSKTNGTHWTALAKNHEKVFYFDSFGNLPPPLEVLGLFAEKNSALLQYEKISNVWDKRVWSSVFKVFKSFLVIFREYINWCVCYNLI